MKLNTLEIGATGNGTSPFVVNRIRGFPGTKKLHYCRPTGATTVTVHITINISPSTHTWLRVSFFLEDWFIIYFYFTYYVFTTVA